MATISRKWIAQRAKDRCEYCQLPQAETVLPHEIDHIRAKKHRGPTTAHNTCWACASCNSAKGSDVAAYDPESGDLVALFNPRADAWETHFVWDGPLLVGKTPVGRATIELLKINDPVRIAHRRLLMAAGRF